jgi:hypothetical protein
VRTLEKTTRDASPFCGIPMVFLFESETILAKMTIVNDLMANQKSDDLFEAPKEKSG